MPILELCLRYGFYPSFYKLKRTSFEVRYLHDNIKADADTLDVVDRDLELMLVDN